MAIEQGLNIQKTWVLPYLSKHFNKEKCKNSCFKVQILEKMEDTGRTVRNVLDASQTPKKKVREKFRMLQLGTVFPHSLNNRLGNEFKTPEKEVLNGRKFPLLPRIHHRVGCGLHDTKAVVQCS